MKILIIINNLGIGGAERLVVDDINEMLKRGLDVKLMTLKPEKEGKTLALQCKIPKEDWIQNDFGSLLNVKSWFKVMKDIRAFRPDVLVSHLWYSNVIGRIAAKVCGVKKIITFEHNVYDTLKTGKMFWADRLLQGLSTRIVAVSKAVKESLIEHGIEEKKIEVILNGIDTSKYEIPPVKNVRVELGLDSQFIFVFIGRLIHQKGVDILLNAFQKVVKKSPDSVLLLVGEGDKKEELRTLSRSLGIEGNTHFLGSRDDIPSILASADCFVLPSRYEGLPMVLLEAIAAHKVIIAADFESATEVLTDDQNGIIVPREDAGELFRAMASVSGDLGLRDRLKKGVVRDSERVSVVRHIDALLECAN